MRRQSDTKHRRANDTFLLFTNEETRASANSERSIAPQAKMVATTVAGWGGRKKAAVAKIHKARQSVVVAVCSV